MNRIQLRIGRRCMLLLGAATVLSAQKAKPLGRSIDVCTALQSTATELMSVRGTGWNSPDGLVIGDRTCPVEQSSTTELPAMILLENLSFASKSDQELFGGMRISRHGVSDPVQVYVRGRLVSRPISGFDKAMTEISLREMAMVRSD